MQKLLAISLLVISVGLSAIACNDDSTTGDTNDDQNQNPSTPACKSADDCNSGQFCNSHATCQPRVAPGTPTETLTITITGRGSVTASDGTNNYGQCALASCGYDVPQGAKGTLLAQPIAGWAFTSWGGDCTGTTASFDITMNAAKTCSAKFTQTTTTPPDQVTVSAVADPDTLGSVVVSACDAATSCAVDVGTHVIMTATAGESARFGEWSGEGCTVGEVASVVAFDAANDTACTASFIHEESVSVTADEGCTATVTVAECAAPSCTCDEAYTTCTADEGTTFTLTVEPGSSIGFTGWTGEGCPSGSNLTQVLSHSAVCNATCAPLYTVSADASPGGSASVVCTASSGGDPIPCEAVFAGTTAVFTATPDQDASFAGWTCTGAVLTDDNPHTVTVSSDVTCTASFLLST
jgi:hypothetical protein